MSSKYIADLKTTGPVFKDSLNILKRLYKLNSIEKLEDELFERNLLLKASKRRIQNVYGSIKKRYISNITNEDIANSPLLLIINHISDEEAIKILYYHLCLSDKLIYDFVVNTVYPRYIKGFLGVSNTDSENFLIKSSETHEEMKSWSERTYKDLKSALITVLLETELLKNRKNPVFNEALYISNKVFGYLLYSNKEKIKTIADLNNNDDFKLLLLDKTDRKLLLKELENTGVVYLNDDGKETNVEYLFPSLKEYVANYVVGKDRENKKHDF